jgi:putative ABC transport system ATP-binding protein
MKNTPLIQLRGVTKSFQTGDVTTEVLHGIDLDIHAGEFVAIMGPSGSGKSTLMHVMSFLDTLSTGSYAYAGQDITQFDEDKLANMRNTHIGFVFQAFHLLKRTTVRDNVMLPLLYTSISKQEAAQKVAAAIHAVGLDHRIDHYSNQLSGGEKQRVAIARAIVNDPDLLFADEPTGNLDSVSGNDVLRILQEINDQGRTVIMVTHEQDTANHAKRILRLRDGLLEADESGFTQRRAEDGALTK